MTLERVSSTCVSAPRMLGGKGGELMGRLVISCGCVSENRLNP